MCSASTGCRPRYSARLGACRYFCNGVMVMVVVVVVEEDSRKGGGAAGYAAGRPVINMRCGLGAALNVSCQGEMITRRGKRGGNHV